MFTSTRSRAPVPARAAVLTRPVLSIVLACVAAAPAAWTPPARAQAAAMEHVPGRVVVATRAGLGAAELGRIVGAQGGQARRLGNTELHVVELPAQVSAVAVRNLLARHPMLRFAELDVRLRVAASNDPYLGSEWHLSRINAPTAWQSATGAGVTIAVLDTGVDGAHPDLASRMVAGWNFFDRNANTADVTGHGTAVAGAAAATLNNGVGVASVAGLARIMPLRVTDAGGFASASTIAEAIAWAADSGARVANVSISGAPGNATIQTAAQYMKSRGGLVVVSAGNTGADIGAGAQASMIPVSATGSSDQLMSWSSFGAAVAIAAPGDSIWTTQRGGSYGAWWGTSMASPVAAGVVALMMSARPDLSAAQVESLLYTSALDLGPPGRDSQFGFGRIDAAAAVSAAMRAAAADTQAPSVAIASPAGGTVVQGLVAVDVTATDNVGVARVELRVNGAAVASDGAVPFQFAWDSARLANGTHVLEAFAFDIAGNVRGSAPVSVSVANPVVVDASPPAVRITSPSAGAQVAGGVSITMSANDNSGTAALRNALYVNGALIASGAGATLTGRWNTRKLRPGVYTVQAVSTDAAGNRGVHSIDLRL